MGRHHLKLPPGLYLANAPPPQTTTSSSIPFATSLLSVRSAVYQSSSVTSFQDSYGARAVGDKIPGFKTSAAFFTTLRANLTIDLESPPPSLCNTPDLRPSNMASSIASLPPPSPSPLAYVEGPPSAEPAGFSSDAPPPLATSVASTEDDKVEVLHLIADSVAQQRQYASSAILYHPVTLALEILILGFLHNRLYKGNSSDWAIIMTTFAGTVMATLAAVRLVTKGFIDEAESVGTWKWLEKDRDTNDVVGDDELILSRYGDQAIGSLILRGQRDVSTNSPSSGSGQRKRRQNSNGKNAPVTGLIRGWTVKNRYRQKGVGTELLEEAIKICQQKGWQGPDIAPDHANSKRHLPAFFAGPLEKRDAKARRLLEKTKDAMGVGAAANAGSKKRR